MMGSVLGALICHLGDRELQRHTTLKKAGVMNVNEWAHWSS